MALTTYFGERDRHEGRFVADALIDLYERHGIEQSVLLRGIAGFGSKQRLRTTQLLTLSEDLPIVSMAVDDGERLNALLPELRDIAFDGLVTIENAAADAPPEAKLTIWLGRYRSPTHVDVVEQLRTAGIAGATVLLGVDGTVGAQRRRARLIGANADVPKLVVAVGDGAALSEAAAGSVHTLETVTVIKHDGVRRADPPPAPAGMLRKLTLYTSEQGPYMEIIRRLRAARAPGATALRGVWGYHGDHAPHGDRLTALRRRVPVVLTMVDDADDAARLFESVVDPLTAERGLVTNEWVPSAERATFQV